MKSLLLTLWFWLTTSHACCKCKTVTHRAWIDIGPQEIECADGKKIKLPRVSHGYCQRCFDHTFGKFNETSL